MYMYHIYVKVEICQSEYHNTQVESDIRAWVGRILGFKFRPAYPPPHLPTSLPTRRVPFIVNAPASWGGTW